MKNRVEQKLKAFGFAPSTIRSCLNGTRKPNATVRNELRRLVPFNVWGKDIRAWLSAQEAKQAKGEVTIKAKK